MKWICQRCGYIVERDGYTEICPQCWEPTMKGEYLDEQCETNTDQEGN